MVTHHAGIDLSTGVRGAPIVAVDGGTVVYVQNTCVEGDLECGGRFGNRVEIDHGNGVVTAYNHLENVNVVEGQPVSKGQQIGGEGSTGRSTGLHLDFHLLCLHRNLVIWKMQRNALLRKLKVFADLRLTKLRSWTNWSSRETPTIKPMQRVIILGYFM